MPGWSTGCFGSFKKTSDSFYNKNNLDQNDERPSSTISDDRKGTSIVELEKIDGVTLGLTISGGVDKNSRPKISSLRPGSIAHRCDALAVGDYIISVNGIRTCKLKHEEIVTLLKNAGSKVMLEIEYEIPFTLNLPTTVTSKAIQIKLEKEKESFGFTLRGGINTDRTKSRPLVLTHIRFGGPADRTGILKAGDRLLAVDGVNLSTATLQDALQFLKQLKQNALFTIEYDVSCIDAVRNATGPLLIEIDRTPGSLLGINLSSLSVPEHTIVIESIRQASIAERCGALHVGDHVLAIDGIKVDLMTAAETMQLLRASVGEIVKLEILPISLVVRSASEQCSKRGELFSNTNYPYASITPFATKKRSDVPNGYNSFYDTVLPSSSDAVSLNSNSNGISSVAHADRTEVILHADSKGFGFNIQGSSYPSDVIITPPIITSIDQGSPAERSSVLQVGDRVLAVNTESTEGMSIDKITNIISNSLPKLTLIIEFDVAEAVVPSSGIFMVKLAKTVADLGISLTASRKRQRGESLIIASVKKGSVAHRTGTIQPGDQLLGINSLRTENCTVDDAMAILQTCSDIVKLRIRKDETFSEDPDATCAIVYTVELMRHGGPLGITVSGTRDPFDPIYISGLTENGLAERTGALHVGDRILAINGSSLRGKSLNEAVCILQTCGDVVTLKISKCPCPERTENSNMRLKRLHCIPDSRGKNFSTPLPSIDSAVDSWDSCNPGLGLDMCCNKDDTLYEIDSRDNVPTSYSDSLEHSKVAIADHNNREVLWDPKFPVSNSFSENTSVISEEERESWSKVLEDLQTCGESRLLRQLEHSILGMDENANEEKLGSDETSESHLKCSDAYSDNNVQDLSSKMGRLDATFKENGCIPDVIRQFNPKECNFRHSVCDESNFYCPPSSSYSVPLPIEIHKVTLFKDQIYEDFGFSLSDGKYESGVYINSIRPGGSADLSGLIKPLDRILQVNGVKTYNAGLIVPLIASSGDRIELVISRPAYDDDSSSDGTLGMTSNYNHWIDDDGDKDDSTSLFYPIPETKTFTKTL